MEKRIDALEEELKVLKNQVKAVLLDIKEYLATGNGQVFVPAAASSSPIGPTQGSTPGPVEVPGPAEPDNVHVCAEPEPRLSRHAEEESYRASDRHGEPESNRAAPSEMAQAAGTSALAIAHQGGAPVMDLLTVSVVAQWMSRAIEAVGKDQIDKLVEIYDITSSLPPGLKETMLLLSELYGGGSEAEDASGEGRQVPATVSVQLLIELDSLLRYRQGALESVVFSMLVDRGLGAGSNGHG